MRFIVFAALFFCVACSDTTLRSPKSDTNIDDSDDPSQSMNGVKLDAASDALPDGDTTCSSAIDCTAPYRCIFPIALGCGAKGSCVLYQDPPMCTQKLACGCDGKNVALCAPDGYAPAPVRSSTPCPSDASMD